jgi:hypothetical protein
LPSPLLARPRPARPPAAPPAQLLEDGRFGFELLRNTIARYANLKDELQKESAEISVGGTASANLWVAMQSMEAGLNLGPYYKAWGWPVTAETLNLLSTLPTYGAPNPLPYPPQPPAGQISPALGRAVPPPISHSKLSRSPPLRADPSLLTAKGTGASNATNATSTTGVATPSGGSSSSLSTNATGSAGNGTSVGSERSGNSAPGLAAGGWAALAACVAAFMML